MFTKFVLAASAAFLGSAALSAPAPAPSPAPAIAPSAAVALALAHGTSHGRFELPPHPYREGRAEGVVRRADGSPLYRLDAVLTETVSTIHVLRTGVLQGELLDSSGAAYPKIRIYGTWVGVATLGFGSFDAAVTLQASPGSLVVQIGRMSGEYGVDVSSPIQSGRFDAVWRAHL